MADDLDDFFNDVEEAAAEAVKEEEQQEQASEEIIEEPPAKRAKTAVAAAPVRPRGVVVAASSSVVKHKPPSLDDDEADLLGSASLDLHSGNNQPLPKVSAAPPPPPPPPPAPLPQSNNNNTSTNNNTSSSKKSTKRMAAGKVWVDPTLEEWPENDFRIFCGNLDRSTTDAQLYDHFKKYASIAKAKVVKEQSGISKGFGFVSFLQPLDCAKAIREMDQTWLGSRPIRVKRSDWKDRSMGQVMKKKKKEAKQRKRFDT